MSNRKNVKFDLFPKKDDNNEEMKGEEPEVADNKEDVGLETPWDEPFDLEALLDTLKGQLHHLATFLVGRLTAEYDEDFFYRTLCLSNTGYKFSELNNDKLCTKSLFWRNGRSGPMGGTTSPIIQMVSR